jgi:hypothetical protein
MAVRSAPVCVARRSGPIIVVMSRLQPEPLRGDHHAIVREPALKAIASLPDPDAATISLNRMERGRR